VKSATNLRLLVFQFCCTLTKKLKKLFFKPNLLGITKIYRSFKMMKDLSFVLPVVGAIVAVILTSFLLFSKRKRIDIRLVSRVAIPTTILLAVIYLVLACIGTDRIMTVVSCWGVVVWMVDLIAWVS
jgi:hypothetical protein